MARNNFSFEKRQKEIDKKKKKEEKQQRKLGKVKSQSAENSEQARDEVNPESDNL